MLKIYCSDFLLERHYAVQGQSLLCHMCVSSLPWVLQCMSASNIFCNLCRISLSAGLLFETQYNYYRLSKTQSLPVFVIHFPLILILDSFFFQAN